MQDACCAMCVCARAHYKENSTVTQRIIKFLFFFSFIQQMSDITETQETKSSQKTVTERVPGTTILPLARIKRVIKEDKDVSLINAEATFCIAYATVCSLTP